MIIIIIIIIIILILTVSFTLHSRTLKRAHVRRLIIYTSLCWLVVQNTRTPLILTTSSNQSRPTQEVNAFYLNKTCTQIYIIVSRECFEEGACAENVQRTNGQTDVKQQI